MSKPKGTAFTKPEPIDGMMNLRKWIDRGTARVVKRVEVCMAASLEAEIEELNAQLQAAQGKRLGIVDERLNSTAPDVRELAQRIQDLRDEMRDSMVTLKFTGLSADQIEACRSAATVGEDGEPDPEEIGYRMLAAQCVEPAGVTWEDMRDLGKAMGDRPFIERVHRVAQSAMAGVVNIPFSLAASQILATPESSES